jgi:hypothetical protein
LNDFEAFKNIFRGFLKKFSENGGFHEKSVVFSKIARLFEDIFKVVEVLFSNVEAFIKMIRLFENLFREVETF